MTYEQARSLIQQEFDVVPAIQPTTPSTAAVSLPTDRWLAFAEFARHTLGCSFFAFLTAIDWKEAGLEVIARLESLEAGFAIVMRTKLATADPVTCPSLVSVFRGANWMERECFDMFGIRFDAHPDLRRILLSDDWQGYPLLKSYAVDTPYPPYR